VAEAGRGDDHAPRVGDERILAGRVAVITGASRGLGRAIAEAFTLAGARLALLARDVGGLTATVERVRELGGDALAISCDLTDPDAVTRATARIIDELGTPDVVVANAGDPGPTRPLHEITPAEWRATVASNLDSVFLTFGAFVPGMLERGSGSLVAVSSVTGKRPLPGRTPYAAAKLGVVGLTRTLAAELGPVGIRVNTVCPGPIEGDRLERVIAARAAVGDTTEAALRARLVEESALRRTVTAAEVAAACRFLASDAASGISGQELDVSAGAARW
jgi:NAD(P)-dependent dehydrogenase (short-subunit alcohol dehydrogenase family)